MNKVAILFAAGIGMIAVAAPAAAQDYRHRDGRNYDSRYGREYRPAGGYDINLRQDELRSKIQAGVRSGRINRDEQYQLNVKMRGIANLEARYRANGLNGRERADLEHRLNNVENYVRRFNRNDSYRR